MSGSAQLFLRIGYALAVVVTLPLLLLYFIGLFLELEDNGGWFTNIAIGLMFFGVIFGFPFWLLLSGAKWVVTGRGLAL